MTRIYISYSHKDRNFVRRLATDLAERLSDAEIRYDVTIASGESFVEALAVVAQSGCVRTLNS